MNLSEASLENNGLEVKGFMLGELMTQEDYGTLVDRLLGSFDDLEKAISGARQSLERNKQVPATVYERLDSYSGILEKQRNLAHQLEDHVKEKNASEISRIVNVINGLSGMIIEDAKWILASLTGEEAAADAAIDDIKIC